MKIRTVAAAVLAALFAAPAFGQTDLDGSFPEDAGIAFDVMHQAISASFSDPQSAQYRGLMLRRTARYEPVICGWVNARNAMGGYTPFVPFSFDVTDGSVVLHEGFDDPILGTLTKTAMQVRGCSASAMGI